MRRCRYFAVSFTLWAFVAMAATVVHGAREQNPPPAGHEDDGWTIPPGAENEKSPLPASPAVLAAGAKVFESKCQRCHGRTGKGNGPDSEPEHRKDMNLTDPARAARNPDGVIFYRVWNGRKSPKMPVFSRELSKEQIWAVVAYVQTLRGK